MQRNYKLIVSIIALTVSSFCVFAQDTVEYKDVFLDGKPAKLNVATGEVTLVKPKTKVVETPTSSGNYNGTLVTDSNVTNTSNVTGSDSNNTSDFYNVKEGETLLDVAKKYKVSLTELKRANNLETTLISKGQKLRVKNFDSYISSTAVNTSYSENTDSNFHIVESGNTLFSLARRFNLSVNELKALNNLNSNKIIIGQKLRVSGSETLNENYDTSVYIVKRGDNLYRIALNNGTTVDALKRLNNLTSNVIKIGQKLQLR